MGVKQHVCEKNNNAKGFRIIFYIGKYPLEVRHVREMCINYVKLHVCINAYIVPISTQESSQTVNEPFIISKSIYTAWMLGLWWFIKQTYVKAIQVVKNKFAKATMVYTKYMYMLKLQLLINTYVKATAVDKTIHASNPAMELFNVLSFTILCTEKQHVFLVHSVPIEY